MSEISIDFVRRHKANEFFESEYRKCEELNKRKLDSFHNKVLIWIVIWLGILMVSYILKELPIMLTAIIMMLLSIILTIQYEKRFYIIKKTDLYWDYLVTSDWKVIIDRANPVISNKNVSCKGEYVLIIGDVYAFVITKKQFKQLKALENSNGILTVDLREMVQFENRFCRNKKERYNNSNIYNDFIED